MSRSLSDLETAKLIEHVPVLLGPREQRFRRLLWSREVSEWWESVKGLSSSSLATLPEQLNQAFAEFIAGRPMTGMTKCDPPKGQGIWRLKTPDMRLYGWAPASQTLVLLAAELKRNLVKPGPPKDRDLGVLVVQRRRAFRCETVIFGDVSSVFPRASG